MVCSERRHLRHGCVRSLAVHREPKSRRRFPDRLGRHFLAAIRPVAALDRGTKARTRLPGRGATGLLCACQALRARGEKGRTAVWNGRGLCRLGSRGYDRGMTLLVLSYTVGLR